MEKCRLSVKFAWLCALMEQTQKNESMNRLCCHKAVEGILLSTLLYINDIILFVFTFFKKCSYYFAVFSEGFFVVK